MGEAALKLVEEPLPVDQKALTYAEIVSALPAITTAAEYIRIGDLWKEGRALLKEIDDGYDDLIKAAHKLHKDAVAKKAKYYNPVDGAVRAAKSLMSSWDAEQERKRREEEARLAEIARKQAEEQALLDAIAAEEEAKANGATKEEAKKEADAIIAEPVYVAPVVLPKATPKLQGGPVYREVWSAECVDVVVLCRAVSEGKASRECVLPNMPALNKMATALKNTMNIPGIRAVSRRV